MRRHGFLRALLAVAALAVPAWSLALEEQSLLTPDGTLHVLRAGRAVDLGVGGVAPESILIEHATRAQDGSTTLAILPGSESFQNKRGLQVGYDEQTSALLLLWTEDISAAYSHIRLGVFRDGAWTNAPLLPSEGISRAFNPRMQVTHQQVTYLDEHDATVTKTSSIVSVIWWEESAANQARLGVLFLDAAPFDPANLSVYDLPALTGSVGATTYGDAPSGAYLFPSLQPDGLSGAILASYADLNADQLRVLSIQFPAFQGKPSEDGNTDWKRRHIPIVGIASSGPIPDRAPGVKDKLGVGTSIGSGYRPTLYWLDENSLKYTRLGTTEWEPVRSIAIDENMTYDRALALVVGMGSRN